MTPENVSDRLWSYGIFFGWLSVIALAMASYAWNRFRASLKDPLTPSTADKSEMWQQTCGFWMMVGVMMAILSILCIMLWRVL